MKSLSSFIVISTAALILASAPANAEKGGHGHGKSKHKTEKYYNKHKDDDRAVVFVGSDRDIIRAYLGNEYRRSCPPGLAKKHNGCRPPGHTKSYRIGDPLMVGWEPVPNVLLSRLHPAPYGYRYVMVDQDVLLIGEATKHVIDAVTLLSAVGY